jgi:hypothetical protein
MRVFLLRLALAIASMFCVVWASSAEPARRELTAAETAALQEPIDLGKRVYAALCRYWSSSKPVEGAARYPDLVTASPTVDLLHALGYIADSDMKLTGQYKVVIPPVVGEKPMAPVVAMQTKYGEISFDIRGEIRLQSSH